MGCLNQSHKNAFLKLTFFSFITPISAQKISKSREFVHNRLTNHTLTDI